MTYFSIFVIQFSNAEYDLMLLRPSLSYNDMTKLYPLGSTKRKREIRKHKLLLKYNCITLIFHFKYD